MTSLFREFIHLDRKRGEAGLSPVELKRWTELKRSLAQKFTPDVSDARADQRESVRIPTRLTVSFSDVGQFRSSYLSNLSRGGLFVVTEFPAEIGTRLMLKVQIDDPREVLDVPVEVVSQDVGPDFPTGTRGMGCAFRDLSPDVKKRLEELYELELRIASADAR